MDAEKGFDFSEHHQSNTQSQKLQKDAKLEIKRDSTENGSKKTFLSANPVPWASSNLSNHAEENESLRIPIKCDIESCYEDLFNDILEMDGLSQRNIIESLNVEQN